MDKRKKILPAFSFLMFLIIIGILFSMHKIDKQTVQNTTEYAATVSEKQITDTGKTIYIEILTQEYGNALQISTNISGHIDLNDIHDLQTGEQIFFRIENIKIDQVNNVEFLNIVSLKTAEKEIFSLHDYNEMIRSAVFPAKTAGIVLAVLFLSMSVYHFISFKKKRT